MSKYAVIIPSKDLDNLNACVASIRACGEDCQIIVIDDGIEWPWEEETPREWGDVSVYQGTAPFIFARAVNEGIKYAGDLDVLTCNDDALLQSPNGFAQLSQVAAKFSQWGIIGATTNVTGYPVQWRSGENAELRLAQTIAFVCVYISRRTLNTVGLLDERFDCYGGEDVDYCIRVREAGLKVGVSDYCFVDHASLHSTFRGDPKGPGDIAEGVRLLREKWGEKCPRFPGV